MTAPTDNMARILPLLPEPAAAPSNLDLAFRRITAAQWLSQTDGHVLDTFQALLARGRFTEAAECLLAHLKRTEVTRTREHGPGPSWAKAVADFEAAVRRITHQTRVGGVNATEPAVTSPARSDEGRSPIAAHTASSCAPDAPSLSPVPGPPCGHVDDRTGLACATDQHPRNPGAHYYRSAAARGGAR